jgi:hypothetical protein
MLRAISQIMAFCYGRAANAREQAQNAKDLDSSTLWFRAEDRRLKLAEHQDAAERVTTFLGVQPNDLSYRIRELGAGSWEWTVYGTDSNILASGKTTSMVEARVAALGFPRGMERGTAHAVPRVPSAIRRIAPAARSISGYRSCDSRDETRPQ